MGKGRTGLDFKKGKEWCEFMFINGIYGQYYSPSQKEKDKAAYGFMPKQAELITESVEQLLFGEVTKEIMQIIEAICPSETQAEAVRKLVMDGLRRKNGQFITLLKRWTKEEQNKVIGNTIRPLAKWQNEVITGCQKKLWVEIERGAGKTTTAKIASLLRHTLVVGNWKEDVSEFKGCEIDYVAAKHLSGHDFSKYDQIILDDVITCDLHDIIKSYTGRIVVLSTDKKEYSPDYIAPLPLTDEWVFVKV